jgi:transposase
MTLSKILPHIWLYTFSFLPSSSSYTHYNMTKHLSSEHIQCVLTLLDKHTPYRQIQAQTHVGLATISCIRAEHRPELPSSIGGHPNLLSPADQRHAIRLVIGTKSATTRQAAGELSQVTGQVILPRTIRKALNRAGLKAVVKKKKPEHGWSEGSSQEEKALSQACSYEGQERICPVPSSLDCG